MFVRVVVNCGAGSVDGDAIDGQRSEITGALAAVGVDSEIAFVSGKGLERALTEAARAVPDAVVVAGGDGTLGTAAAALADGDVPLGVLPLGTFNHFAKDLGIPVDLASAAALIADGEVLRVDIGDVNGRTFVNNSSLGVYPVMVAMRDDLREERGWGKVRAVPVAAWRVLRRFPARRLAITADGYQATLRTPFVFIGNNRYEVGAGALADRSTIVDGELCLYVARASSRARLVWMALKAVVRGGSSVADLDQHDTTAITVEAGRHRLRVAVDGEVTTLRAPLLYKVRPAALPVLVPPPPAPVSGEVRVDESGADAAPAT